MDFDKPSHLTETDHSWLHYMLPMDIYTDCESLWGIKQGNRSPLEANLLPDLSQIRRSHEEQRIRKSSWIPTIDMFVDALTKEMDGEAMRSLARGVWLSSGIVAWKCGDNP